MEMHRLKGLYNLAKDILDNSTKIRFDEKHFNNDDYQQHSLHF